MAQLFFDSGKGCLGFLTSDFQSQQRFERTGFGETIDIAKKDGKKAEDFVLERRTLSFGRVEETKVYIDGRSESIILGG